jgi:ubiquinone/menaquinone biosynthesis C-methylase UbiE
MDERLKKFIDANFSSPGKALDLGCGEGKDLRALRDAAGHNHWHVVLLCQAGGKV